LLLSLEALSFLELATGCGHAAALVEHIREDGAFAHSLEPVAAPVSKLDCHTGSVDGFLHVADREEEFAEVAVVSSGIPPTRLLHSGASCCSHRVDGIGEAAQGTERKGQFGNDPGLIGGRQ
jgi:hypothetical protein